MFNPENELNTLKDYFCELSQGSYPMCLDYAIEAIQKVKAYEKAKSEIYQLPLCWEYGQGVQDCIDILEKYTEVQK